jgi:thimet oligopeptidase
VTRGMLEVYQDLFSLRFEEATDAPTWHPDVRMFDVYDRSSNAFMGQFYLDLWPREGKYSHAAVFPLIPSHHFPQNSEVLALPDIPTSFSSNLHPVSDGESRQGKMLKQAPVAAMVANFTKPRADRPSLLTHDEVETYFHEFGHVMHNICTSAKYARFSGTSVERDFVEAPSQVATSFCHVKSLRTYFSGPHSRCWRIGAMRRKC